MIAVWITFVGLVAALATAMTLGWRKWSAEPVRAVAPQVKNCGCYPRVKR